MNAQDDKKIVVQFELKNEPPDLEEIDIVATVLAELLRDTEALLKQGKE